MAAEHAHGRFGGTSQRPYIEATLVIPGIRVIGNVSFLVDTGADSTCLSNSDAIRLGIDYGALSDRSVCGGIGGQVAIYPVQAYITFAGTANLFAYEIELDILEDGSGRDIPSLLGRDVLDRTPMIYDKIQGVLSLELSNADHVIPI